MEPTGTNGRTRHTLSDPCGSGLVLWWFSRWMARNAVSCGHDDDTGKAFDLLASVVRFPDRHDRNRSCGWFRCRPPVFPVGRLEWFCGGHGPGETPGPFPNPEAKAWHGDGTALERVWESSAPPHSTLGVPVELRLREPPFLFFFRIFPGLHGPPGNAFQARRRCFSVACVPLVPPDLPAGHP